MKRRNFSHRQKRVLYLLADDVCQICGKPLPRGWHADHVYPHSKGGETDIPNGQATCPHCNQQKGAKVDEQD